MDKIHWTVVPVLLFVGWLALAAAALVTFDEIGSFALTVPAPAAPECEPVVVVGVAP